MLCALLGVMVLAAGLVLAWKQRSDAFRVLAGLILVDFGQILLGFGFGWAAGQTGALLTLAYNGAARLLAWLCLLELRAYAEGRELRGISKERPWTALLFSLAMFAGLKVSPFFAPESKSLILYAGLEAVEYPLVALLTLGNAVMVLFTAMIVQEVWMGGPYLAEKRRSEASPRLYGLVLLAAILAAQGLFRHQITEFTGSLVDLGALPEMETKVHSVVWVMYGGAFAVFALGFVSHRLRNLAAVALPAAAMGMLLTESGVWPPARFFGVIVTGMGCLVALYSWGYIHKKNSNAYYGCLTLMFASLAGVGMADGVTGFFVFWELMTLSSYVLVAWEDTPAAQAAARKYFIMCSMAAELMLPGLLLIPIFGFVMPVWAILPSALLILVGCGVKAGLFPVHSWLPDAHPAAPSSISGPLSGVLTKAGIFGLAQLFILVLGLRTGEIPELTWLGLPLPGIILTGMGLLTMAYGEIMALRQTDVKRLLAYSTMGQIGEISMTLGLCGWLAASGALLHVLNHAVMKDLLFLCSGALILRAGGRDLKDLRGLGKAMPFTSACMVVGLISILGLPPFAGFMSKFLMLYALAAVNPLLAGLLLLASLAGVVYYTRIIRTLLFEPYTGPQVEEAPWSMRLPLAILALLCLILGLFPQVGLNSLVMPMVENLGLAVQEMPRLMVAWPAPVLLLLASSMLPALLRKNPKRAGQAAAIALALAAWLLLADRQSLDTLSLMFAMIITLAGCVNMLYSVVYMEHSHTQWRFYSFFLCMAAGLVGVAVSTDLFSFFLFWEIMSSWSLYFVIVHEENQAALREGFKYFFFNVLGAAFIFLGVVLLIHWSGGADFRLVRAALPRMEDWQILFTVLLMGTGFIMKAAQLPFRIDVQMHPATAPTPVSGYISSVLLKSAIFGLIQLFLRLGGLTQPGSLGLPQVMDLAIWVGGVTIVMAALFAVFQSDVKLVLIYSTVSQLGYMVTGVALGTSLGVAGGLLHLVNHVFFKDLLFLVAGALIVRTHRQSMNEMGGLGRRMPYTLAFFAIGAVCVIGLPPSSGFTSKWIIYHALMERGFVLVAIFSLVGSVLTLAYFAKMLHSVFLGQPGPGMEEIREAPRVMLIPMGLLAAGCVCTSLFPGLVLAPLNSVLAEFSMNPLDVAPWGINSGRGAWNATLTAVLFALAWAASGLLLRRLSRKERVTAIHVCGTALEDLNPRTLTGDIYSEPARMARRKPSTSAV